MLRLRGSRMDAFQWGGLDTADDNWVRGSLPSFSAIEVQNLALMRLHHNSCVGWPHFEAVIVNPATLT
jgi:hypothetical protein